MIWQEWFRDQFLSTPSARRATDYFVFKVYEPKISIHALREEGDHRQFDFARRSAYFYPRPPRGGRPRSFPLDSQFFYFYPRPPRGGRLIIFLRRPAEKRFLSTPSARRATGFDVVCRGWSVISIHALREEGDHFRP